MKKNMIQSLFADNYIYAPIIYKLIKDNKLNNYITKLKENEYYIKINNNKVEYYKHFLMMIDNFIDYLVCSLNLNNIQLLNVLDSIFMDLNNPIFLTKSYIKENHKINKITREYKKIILYKFRNNLEFVKGKLNYMMEIYNLDIYDDRVLFNFLIDCCEVRKNHQYILFDDFNEYLDNSKKTDFYLLMWKLLFQKLEEYYIDNNLIT